MRLARPERDPPCAVLITGHCLRHERFARRVAQALSELRIVWYRLRGIRRSERLGKWAALDRLLGPDGNLYRYRQEYGFLRTVARALRSGELVTSGLRTAYHLLRLHSEIKRAEERILSEELRELRAARPLTPCEVADPFSEEFLQEVRSHRPYFLLTCGGPLHRPELLSCARGAALNQHAGWSPTFRGSHTVTWALYHRDLSRVASTVHLLVSGADAGPVVRYGWATLTGCETLGECFVRVVALGTELMIEVVQEALSEGSLVVYDQEPYAGKTYLAAECTGRIFALVRRDLKRRWIKYELNRLGTF